MLVEREREIRAFVPEEFWELHADTLTAAKEALRLEVRREGEQNFRPGNREEAERAVRALEKARYVVRAREDKPTRTRPSAPFITSTLQQAASTRLGFSVKKTMMLAQRLYEAGFITYMRTDSTNLSAEAVAACRDYIGARARRELRPGKAQRLQQQGRCAGSARGDPPVRRDARARCPRGRGARRGEGSTS